MKRWAARPVGCRAHRIYLARIFGRLQETDGERTMARRRVFSGDSRHPRQHRTDADADDNPAGEQLVDVAREAAGEHSDHHHDKRGED